MVRRIEVINGVPTFADVVGHGTQWRRENVREILSFDAHDARLWNPCERGGSPIQLTLEERNRIYAAAPERNRSMGQPFRAPCRSDADRAECPLCRRRALQQAAAAIGRIATEIDYIFERVCYAGRRYSEVHRAVVQHLADPIVSLDANDYTRINEYNEGDHDQARHRHARSHRRDRQGSR